VSNLFGEFNLLEVSSGRAGDLICRTNMHLSNFDVLLTVHLSIILVINQLNAQNLVL